MYSAKIDGEPTTFGTSGMLYRSNKLMYDRATESLWNQFTGEPIAGPLADSGVKLPFFPSVLTTWEEWVDEHPDTTALDVETGVYPSDVYKHEWETDAVYYGYFNSPLTMFPVFGRSGDLAQKETVIGVRLGGEAKAYPVSAFAEEPVINDAVGGQAVALVGRSAFGEARVYERGGETFSTEEGGLLRGADGALWTPGEDALTEIGGEGSLQRIPTITSFWHGWRSFHPDAALYEHD